jgi:hypothetical protein
MIWLYLNKQIKGSCSKKIYGNINDRIFILKNQQEMLLVQNDKGEKFFIKESDYCNTKFTNLLK